MHSESLYPSQEEAMIAQAEFFKTHKFIFKTLTENEASVLRLRYGIDDNQFLAYADISEHVNLTRARIYQIEKTAMSRLRKLERVSLLIKYTDETFDDTILEQMNKNYVSLIRLDIVRTITEDALEVIEDIDIEKLNIKVGKNPRILKRFMERLRNNGIFTCSDFINKVKQYESSHKFIEDLEIDYVSYNAFLKKICELIETGKIRITSQELLDTYNKHVQLNEQKENNIILKKKQKQQELKNQQKINESKRQDRIRDGVRNPELLLIEDLNLSKRPYNALKSIGVNTLADLIALKGDFGNINNLGVVSIGEIIKKTRAIGVDVSPSFMGINVHNIKRL